MFAKLQSYYIYFFFQLENLTFLINDMKNEIVSWARMRQKPENLLNERFQDMAKKALGM